MNPIPAQWSAMLCAALALILAVTGAAARIDATATRNRFHRHENPPLANALRGSRSLRDTTITTPNCSQLRIAPYPAELQLFYTYSVEINADMLLTDMERALENALAIELDMCDVDGRPVYKVRTGTQHSFSTSGRCDPIVTGNTCIVVNGESVIFLDRSSDATFVRNRAYMGISRALGDPAFLEGFSSAVVSAELLSEGHASLVENPVFFSEALEEASYRSGITTTVAVAAASVTIVVASILCYGVMRKTPSDDPSVRHKNRSLRKSSPRTIVSESPLSVPARRHFVRLEDLTPSSFFTTSLSPHGEANARVPHYIRDGFGYGDDEDGDSDSATSDKNLTVNWSVSDITSDSASLRSVVSRTPSTLERIDEEEVEDGEDSLDDGDPSCRFSYSEDSTMITNSLSKAGRMVREDCCDEHEHDPSHKPTNLSQFDCASERRDRVLDLSDLDACFTIRPGETEEVFRDLDDLSSECTQESPLESILLDMKMSSEESEEDSSHASLSDTSVVSMVPLGDSMQPTLTEDSTLSLSVNYAIGEDSEHEYSISGPPQLGDSKLLPLSSASASASASAQEHSNSSTSESNLPPKRKKSEPSSISTPVETSFVAIGDSDAHEETAIEASLPAQDSKANDDGDDALAIVDGHTSKPSLDIEIQVDARDSSVGDLSHVSASTSGDSTQTTEQESLYRSEPATNSTNSSASVPNENPTPTSLCCANDEETNNNADTSTARADDQNNDTT